MTAWLRFAQSCIRTNHKPSGNKCPLEQQLVETVRRALVIWAGSAAAGPGHLTVTESTTNSSLHQSTLEPTAWSSVRQVKIELNQVMQQDDDPKQNLIIYNKMSQN